jgi:hypothetical protein
MGNTPSRGSPPRQRAVAPPAGVRPAPGGYAPTPFYPPVRAPTLLTHSLPSGRPAG